MMRVNKIYKATQNGDVLISRSDANNPESIMINILLESNYDYFLEDIGENKYIRSEYLLNDNINFIKIFKAINGNNTSKYLSPLKLLNRTDNLSNLNRYSNIHFKIGQPDTGKSFSFEEKTLFPNSEKDENYKYLKLSITGGLTGLDQRDISITTDPMSKQPIISSFLTMIMSAIINPEIPHVIFLDDFHNKDISELLSNYMPFLKNQNIVNLSNILSDTFLRESINKLIDISYSSVNNFIIEWNIFIQKIKLKNNDIMINSVTNPNDLNYNIDLIFPNNLYIFGAANWNSNTKHIFADIENRANIEYIQPIFNKEELEKININIVDTQYVELCLLLNLTFKEILENNLIFDYEKYCFGIFKIIKNNEVNVSDVEQKKVIAYFFKMIKNSLIENGHSTEINNYAYEIIKKMISQSNNLFDFFENIMGIKIDKQLFSEDNLEELQIQNEKDYKSVLKILYMLGIYQQ